MPNEDQAQAAFDSFVQLWTTGTTAGRRAPVLRRPDEVGLDYEDVLFPSMDGVPLEGWFIPADSDRLIIHNHFLPGNRYGYPGHLPEFGGLGGFEVIDMRDKAVLIIRYDWRNNSVVFVHNLDDRPCEVSFDVGLDDESAGLLVNLLTEEHSRAREDGRHYLLLEAFAYRWYRVGGLDYLLKRSEIDVKPRLKRRR